QFGGQLDPGTLDRLVADQTLHRAYREPSHVRQRLTDRGQRGRGPTGLRDVVETHHTDVFGYPQATSAQCLVHAKGHLVTGDEHRRGGNGPVEQVLTRPKTGFVREFPRHDQVTVDHQPGRLQTRPVTVEAGTAAPQLRTPLH